MSDLRQRQDAPSEPSKRPSSGPKVSSMDYLASYDAQRLLLIQDYDDAIRKLNQSKEIQK